MRFRPQEALAVNGMLRRLLESPTNFSEHVRHMAGQSIMSIAYGIDVLEKDDPYIRIGETANDIVAATTVPGSYMVDTLPLRKSPCTLHQVWLALISWYAVKYVPEWFPGAGFKRQAREWRGIADAMLNDPFHVTKEAIVSKREHSPS